jgi:hypothetical protein
MRFFVNIFLSLLFWSIQAHAASDLNAAANDACACLKEPYEQVSIALDDINTAKGAGDMSKIMAAQGEMMKVINASSRCFEGLAVKYPDIDQSDELKQIVMDKTEEICPNPAKAMQMN